MRWFRLLTILLVVLVASCSSKSSPNLPVMPQPAPSPQNVTLGPGDQINVIVWRNDDLKRTVYIDPNGYVDFPLVGQIEVSGLTLEGFRAVLQDRLSNYLVNPRVDLTISGLASRKIYVLGEVPNPGVMSTFQDTSVLEIISRAGGFKNSADQKRVVVFRSDGKLLHVSNLSVDLEKISKSNSPHPNAMLKNGDIIYVPPTNLAKLERLMSSIATIISPIIGAEQAIVLGPEVANVLKGASTSTSSSIVIAK